MLRKIISYCLITISCQLPPIVMAETQPMVERHIFTPHQESEKEDQAETAKKITPKELEKQIVFTGIIIGPKGKKIMLRENSAKPSDVNKNKLYGVGDQVKGMTIKEIGNNYMVLSGQDGETQMNLYKGEKQRPAPPAIAAEPPTQNPGMPPQGNPNSGPAGPSQTPSAHGTNAPSEPGLEKAVPAHGPEDENPAPGPGGEASGSNPFAEALKRVAERRANSVNQPSGPVSNPFSNLIK